MLLKQSALYLLFSILLVACAKYAHLLIVYVDMFYTYVNLKLMPVFSSSKLGVMIREIITLVFIPVCIVAVPAFIYRLVKGKSLPYFILATWLLWLIIVLSNILI
ncbi:MULTISPECIES: hypothetical protein [Legionella]|uniref:Uncharacterized protein n=1 Tax=Legionella septentrionalis TaxID=2498109 RepID=A0A3S0VB56_9GAMM|nr:MULTISPECIES: hypothetical protein [Legionella]MCP0914211.1 hypothetical protein [Legionella sp. 27cVA30]RUQ89213.1 hypothetical protein EKM59_03805 [Legionella septentrionalis]RUR00552.1 hypothetical protein ELY11_02005 [Legionella septentrionalis]RUR11753.1 hypothetical protein ELY14_00465 [Legionella septentrionalis]RUR17441.1 hypothetical protein ELY10_00465 [Legionella septentrionalis]